MSLEGFGWAQGGFVEGFGGLLPFEASIARCGVVGSNELELLDSQPAFDLFFSCYRVLDVFETLVVNEFVNFVASGVRFGVGGDFVLMDTQGRLLVTPI
jgi:hypothetical protein